MFVSGVLMIVLGLAMVVGGILVPVDAARPGLIVGGLGVGLGGALCAYLGAPSRHEPAPPGHERAKATILDAAATPGAVAGYQMVELTLEVRPKDGLPFQVRRKFACASCPTDGSAPRGSTETKVNDGLLITGYDRHLPRRLVVSDGPARVFFDTRTALDPADVNDEIDVYEYELGAERARLISSGKDSQPSYLLDVSPSGDDVFFGTFSRLVGTDEDNLFDVYDARVGGGLTSQEGHASPACTGDACKGAPTPAPGSQSAATSQFAGPGSPAPKRKQRGGKHRTKKKSKQRHRKRAAKHSPAKHRSERAANDDRRAHR